MDFSGKNINMKKISLLVLTICLFFSACTYESPGQKNIPGQGAEEAKNLIEELSQKAEEVLDKARVALDSSNIEKAKTLIDSFAVKMEQVQNEIEGEGNLLDKIQKTKEVIERDSKDLADKAREIFKENADKK